MLATLEMANRHRIPTAMVCQGLGPVSDPELFNALRKVLPKVRIISVRERSLSRQILQSLNYPCERTVSVGDDGLQLAFENRAHAVGCAIGVNLRVAKYSQIEVDMINAIRRALESAAINLGTSLISVPILFRDDSDIKTAAELISGHEDPTCGAPVMTPLDVIHRIGRCRLVVTGSYHGAVFALGQGIPAVAVARSQYYLAKFKGLQEQFGDGCQLIDWSGARVTSEELISAIYRAWTSAADLRPALLNIAEEQIQMATDAYSKLQASVSFA
jgi:colanic acid/amylovoran biosynthesis protein